MAIDRDGMKSVSIANSLVAASKWQTKNIDNDKVKRRRTAIATHASISCYFGAFNLQIDNQVVDNRETLPVSTQRWCQFHHRIKSFVVSLESLLGMWTIVAKRLSTRCLSAPSLSWNGPPNRWTSLETDGAANYDVYFIAWNRTKTKNKKAKSFERTIVWNAMRIFTWGSTSPSSTWPKKSFADL